MTLRIQRSVEPRWIILTLTGRIQADQVSDLEALLKSGPLDRGIVLDLKNVRLVDREAVQFLASREAAVAKRSSCARSVRSIAAHSE